MGQKMNKKIKQIEEKLEDYDLGWYKDCYTIPKKSWNKIKKELKI